MKNMISVCSPKRAILAAACLAAASLSAATPLHVWRAADNSPKVYYGAPYAIEKGDKSLELAVITIHGWGGGVKESGGGLRRAIAAHGTKQNVAVFAPLFPRDVVLKKAKIAPDGRATWNGTRTAASDWRGGGDAAGVALSSYDVIDSFMATLSDAKRYPALKRIVLCGFSAGGQFVGRYAAVGKCPVRAGLKVEFAVIAPSTELYLDESVDWHYGIANRPRYAASVTPEQMRANLAARRVWRGCGTKDVTKGSLDTCPAAMRQGKNRYERYRNFQEYVKKFPAWAKMLSFHDIPDVGHSSKVLEDADFLRFVCGE